MIFYYIFGVIGVNYFKNKFYHCEYPLNMRENPPYTKWECLDVGGNWKNLYLNFDNIGKAMGTMFIISNTVQWSEIMYFAARTNDIDVTPSHSGIN